MAKKSAESYVSLKGNDKAISILQNVIKVIQCYYSDTDSDFENH